MKKEKSLGILVTKCNGIQNNQRSRSGEYEDSTGSFSGSNSYYGSLCGGEDNEDNMSCSGRSINIRSRSGGGHKLL